MKLPFLLFSAVAVVTCGGAATAAIHSGEVSSIHGTISIPNNVVAVNSHQRVGDNVSLNPQPLPPKILVVGGETIATQTLAHVAPGIACSALIVSARTADGSVRSTYANGDASSGRCSYDLPIPGPGPVTEITVTSGTEKLTQLHVRGSSLEHGGIVNFAAPH